MGNFPPTRIHLGNFPAPEGTRIFLKREDETGFAASGGKLRKLHSLLPFLLKNGFQEVAVIGSAYSNNVLAVAQICLQHNIVPTLFLKAGHHEGPGNAFFTELLVPKEKWKVVPSADWERVEAIAAEHAENCSHPVFVLPEGAFCPPALTGTMGLFPEIKQQEAALGTSFQHVFIDAGTGLSAAGLILGGKPDGPVVHVVQMAMDEGEFEERMDRCRSWASSVSELPYRIIVPKNAKSFGAVNATVLKDILFFAREYGLLTDPVYSAKHLRESLRVIEEEQLSGDVLIVHSGGCSTLPGFYERLVGK